MKRDDRGAWLLSKAALPRVEVPQFEPQRLRDFKMPRVTPPPIPNDEARFRDRTLSWFKIGEDLEREAAAYEPEPTLSARSRATLAAAAVLVGVSVALWLV